LRGPRTSVLSDGQWSWIQPVFRSSAGRAVRLVRDVRRVVEGIIYRYRCGLPLPVEALPVEMDGLTVGWVWWNDYTATSCEYVPFDMSEEESFGRGRWFDSIERRVRGGMLPSQAVADIRANGVDDAPAYRGEPGGIPEGAQPIRLPYKHFLHSFGGYGSRNARRDDDLTFQRAHTYERRIPADAPVSYIACERERIVMGWLWWSDALDAAWHVPNVPERGWRIKDGVTLQVNHPWAGAWRTCMTRAFRPLEPFKNS
jgi:hypothetical protein